MQRDELLDSHQDCDLVGLNWTLVLAILKTVSFPLAVKDTGRRIPWWRDEVLDWTLWG